MQMTLKQWPAGRWFRDRGNGIGQLWGHRAGDQAAGAVGTGRPDVHVQPALNHIEVLEQRSGGTHVDLRHRTIGFIDPAHRQSVTSGWRHILEGVAQDCSARASAQRS
jgi:hypothetical protein